MFEVRIHGRGGQGVVTAAEILSIAAFKDGLCGQAFPSFGSERMGAPVMAFCRMDQKPIRLREPIMEPDAIIIQDPTLLHQVDLFSGLKPSGFILINSTRNFKELGIHAFIIQFPENNIRTLPATEIALEQIGRPLPNAVLLGGFSALTGKVTLSSLKEAIREKFPGATGEKNAHAAASAFERISPVETGGKSR